MQKVEGSESLQPLHRIRRYRASFWVPFAVAVGVAAALSILVELARRAKLSLDGQPVGRNRPRAREMSAS